MSQVALDVPNCKEKEECYLKYSSGTRLAGIAFLLTVLCAMFVVSWMIFIWIDDAQGEGGIQLSKLVVTGERQYTRNSDIRQLILALGMPSTFMTQDVNVIQSQIEHLPWIKQVSVRKQWPDKLKIHLIEYIPIAHWNNQYMVDVNGNSFCVPPDRLSKQDLPILYGPKGSENEVVNGFIKMEQLLAENGFKLREIVMTARHSWQLTLTNGIKLNLGRNDTIKRLTNFIELYPVLRQTQNIGKQINYIDLRYESGAAVGYDLASIEKSNRQ